MKFFVVASVLAGLAAAQSINDLPQCSQTCIRDSVKNHTSCSATDKACICKNFSAIQQSAINCVISACGTTTAVGQVLPAAKKLCA